MGAWKVYVKHINFEIPIWPPSEDIMTTQRKRKGKKTTVNMKKLIQKDEENMESQIIH